MVRIKPRPADNWPGFGFIIEPTMKINNLVLAFILFLVISITACSGAPASPLATQTLASLGSQGGYPAPIQEATSYPAGKIFVTMLPEGVLPEAPKKAPDTTSDTASISGVLYSYNNRQVIPQTEFFLIPAVGPEKRDVPPVIVSPESKRGEIISTSGDSGEINLKDIPPGNYYIVIWAPMNWVIAQNSESDITPRLIELKAGSRIPLGVVYVSWP